MNSNAWLAGATTVYAGGTLLLAWVTGRGSVRSARTSQETNDAQIEAAAESTARQIEASAEFSSQQIRAAAETTEKQIAAAIDAARIQGHTAAVSQSRQGWINQLRDEVTGFLTEAGMRSIVDDQMRLSDVREAQQLAIGRAMRSHLNKVRLLINPTEGESTELVEMLSKVLTREEWDDVAEERIVTHTQGILKTEWERVKRGD